ncbi:hypothetical protein ACX0G9_25185 [Flavitalea flava]
MSNSPYPSYHSYNRFSGKRAIHLSFVTMLSVMFLISCAKESIPAGTASLTIANGVTGSSILSTNFASDGPVTFYTATQLAYKGYAKNQNQFNAYSGSQRIRLFNYPDTLAKDKPLFDLMVDLPVGSISSLFLTGTIDAPDTLLVHDIIPFFPRDDSAMGIRFVNLSLGSGAISVNIQGAVNGSEVTSLGYKAITDFNRYAVKSSLADYVFEFRDAASGTLLASYTTDQINNPGGPNPNLWIYRSFTIALVGKPDGTGDNAPAAFLLSHY